MNGGEAALVPARLPTAELVEDSDCALVIVPMRLPREGLSALSTVVTGNRLRSGLNRDKRKAHSAESGKIIPRRQQNTRQMLLQGR